MEVADFVAVINIENSNETKMLVIKAVKQRDLDGQTDSNITAIAFNHGSGYFRI